MGTYWAKTGKYQKLYDRLHDLLVSKFGPAGTDSGNLLIEFSRIYHDRYNNGFGNGPHSTVFIEKYAERIQSNMEKIGDFVKFMDLFRNTNKGERVIPNKWRGDLFMEKVGDGVVLTAQELAHEIYPYEFKAVSELKRLLG